MNTLDTLAFDNRYARLPEMFYSRVRPRGFSRPQLVAFNPDVAALIDLDPSEGRRAEFLACFGGQRLPAGSDPIAMKYTGHQFGVYNPELGDGRGLLLGQVRNTRGEYWDLHLKGAGPTPYSRFGDGRAVLRSCIREYLGGEAMHGLGIPTTRALCIIGSDEPVQRETVETGAMLLRVADSHIRFGHFEWLFHSGQHAALRDFVDRVIAWHFPQLTGRPNAHRDFFAEVTARTARLMALWQLVGFAHGVMNSDNFSITGATFDYGPFGFLDAYAPGFICNHSDHQGRYAWHRQPSIGLWNLNALAHALSGLIDRDDLVGILQDYEPALIRHYDAGLRSKLGLAREQPGDRELGIAFLELLMKEGADYTRSFRQLARVGRTDEKPALRDEFVDREAFDAWCRRYQARLRSEAANDAERAAAMNAVNPKYVLRNYMAQVAIERAQQGDFGEIEALRQLLARPFDEQPEMEHYAALPPDWGRHLEISCSS